MAQASFGMSGACLERAWSMSGACSEDKDLYQDDKKLISTSNNIYDKLEGIRMM